MIISKQEPFRMIGESGEALHVTQEVRDLGSGSLSFPDPLGCRVDRVYSGSNWEAWQLSRRRPVF
jgi:hypothetical protein